MTDTVGQTVDKLLTVDLKMWHNQELFYAIRRMQFHEFQHKYSGDEGMLELYECLKKVCDLNVQRSSMIHALDLRLIELIRAVLTDEDLVGTGFLQEQHKTY